MGGKKNPQKEAAAAAKETEKSKKAAKAEEAEWSKGAKDNSKQAAAEQKAAEAARKKAEKEALRREEEASMPDKPKGAGAKTAVKKTRGLDLSQLEGTSSGAPKSAAALNATGIDNALDLLSITGNSQEKVDKHPERRFKAAYAAFEERRLEEMADEKGLRRQQKVDMIRKEFEKSPENPFNAALVGTYDMTKEDKAELIEKQREAVTKRLTGV